MLSTQMFLVCHKACIKTHQMMVQLPDETRDSKMTENADRLTRRRKLRNIIVSFIVTSVFVVVLFVAAGSIRWLWAWILAFIMLLSNIVSILLLDPALIEERTGMKRGYEKKDVPFAFIIGRFGPLAILIVSGLDFRFGWSSSLPAVYAIAGLILLLVGYVPVFWAMYENRFFSGVVRIQEERGHHVINTGPYHFIRHPGYLGSVIYLLALPFVLMSYWALVPAILTIIMIVVRIVMEEDTLKRELAGYVDYMQQVRFRLVPGIW
jgi:protein-S-isoprenylcysteine O-methyltransferase Ste14